MIQKSTKWIYNYLKYGKKNISQEFTLENIDETRYYFLEEINGKKLMIRKPKKAFTTLNYIKHFLILTSVVTGCISISAFPSLACISCRN